MECKLARVRTPEYRAKQHARSQTPERRAYMRARDQTPEYRARRRAEQRANKVQRREKRALYHTCKQLLQRTLRCTGEVKEGRTHKLLGYGPTELRAHLEAQFREGMTWDNWGTAWELDHIREVSLFLDEGCGDPAIINALSNLQPLLIAEHRAKTAAFLAMRRAA